MIKETWADATTRVRPVEREAERLRAEGDRASAEGRYGEAADLLWAASRQFTRAAIIYSARGFFAISVAAVVWLVALGMLVVGA